MSMFACFLLCEHRAMGHGVGADWILLMLPYLKSWLLMLASASNDDTLS